MVGREIELKGLDGLSILFTWKGKKKLFDLLGVKTEDQFYTKWYELHRQDQMPDELYEKMYLIGLNWKKEGQFVKEEDVSDLLEEFCLKNGYGSLEVRDTLVDSFVNSGIFFRALVEAGRKARDGMSGDALAKLIESQNRGTDTGEPQNSSVSTSTN